MSGKADKLKLGAKSTGRGLFKGMEKLNSVSEEKTQETIITNDIANDSEVTETVNENTNENKVNLVEESKVESEKELPVDHEKETPTIFTDDDSKSRRQKEESLAVEDEEDKSDVLQEIFKDVAPDKAVKTPEKTPESEAFATVENVKESVAEPATTDAADKTTQTRANELIINDKFNNIDAHEEKTSKKQNSRYEKDKFLLLDIRGYRDYIEHIAKAANMSATKYIRSLIEKDMEENKEIYLAHKKLEEMLRNKAGN